MTFEEWWPTVNQTIGKAAAKAAWDYQQEQIDVWANRYNIATGTANLLAEKKNALSAECKVHLENLNELDAQLDAQKRDNRDIRLFVIGLIEAMEFLLDAPRKELAEKVKEDMRNGME